MIYLFKVLLLLPFIYYLCACGESCVAEDSPGLWSFSLDEAGIKFVSPQLVDITDKVKPWTTGIISESEPVIDFSLNADDEQARFAVRVFNSGSTFVQNTHSCSTLLKWSPFVELKMWVRNVDSTGRKVEVSDSFVVTGYKINRNIGEPDSEPERLPIPLVDFINIIYNESVEKDLFTPVAEGEPEYVSLWGFQRANELESGFLVLENAGALEIDHGSWVFQLEIVQWNGNVVMAESPVFIVY